MTSAPKDKSPRLQETHAKQRESDARRAPTDQPAASKKTDLTAYFEPLFAGTGGIDSWLGPSTGAEVIERLRRVDSDPLSRSQLNQLLVLSGEAGVTEGFFNYYWLSTPRAHPYETHRVTGFAEDFLEAGEVIHSLAHLKWGLCRFYIDALLYFGNIRSAYRFLRDRELNDVVAFFASLRIDTDQMRRRGPASTCTPSVRTTGT